MASNLLNGHNLTEGNSIITCHTLKKRGGGGDTFLTDKFELNNCPGISNYVWFGKLIHVSLAAIFILASFQINIY